MNTQADARRTSDLVGNVVSRLIFCGIHWSCKPPVRYIYKVRVISKFDYQLNTSVFLNKTLGQSLIGAKGTCQNVRKRSFWIVRPTKKSSLCVWRHCAPWLSKMCPVKILIRMCQCTDLNLRLAHISEGTFSQVWLSVALINIRKATLAPLWLR